MILFVDINDVCRAAVAAAFCQHRLRKEAEHAGVYGTEKTAPSELVLHAADKMGLDLREHTACLLTEQQMQRAERIYGMTAALTAHLRQDYPEYAGKIAAMEIPDPFGQGQDAYERCVQRICTSLEEMDEAAD